MAKHTLHLQAPWTEVKEKLKEVNTSLTDDDLVYHPGKEDELLKRIAERLKKDPSEVKALVESISFNKGKAS
jgi:uncharacterized protein YjbJ (UPF0337 family)